MNPAASTPVQPRADVSPLPLGGVAVPPRPGDPFVAYLANLNSPGSRRALSACLHRIAALLISASGHTPGPYPAHGFPWWALRADHTATLRALISEQHTKPDRHGEQRSWSTTYQNKHLSALRGILKAAWTLGQITTDDHQRARAIKDFKVSRLPTGRSIHVDEFAALLAVCADDPTPAGIRDAALLALLYATGARRAEVAALRREDYDPGERSLRIIGKGNKERMEYLHPIAAALLGAWLALDDRTTGPMFKPIHKHGTIYHRPLSDAAIRNAVTKRRVQAKLPHITPHDFRRTFIGDLLDSGTDIVTVQKLVGHASPDTTAKYDRRPGRKHRDAIDRRPFPTPQPQLTGM